MAIELERRMQYCEERNRRLARLVSMQSLTLVIVLATLIANCTTSRPANGARPLRVSELIVVDSEGIERVRIGGDLPDAVIGGKRMPRGQKAAGLLLYDRAGSERGGYVTWEPSGNVGLTLDSRKQQVAVLVAGAESGSALQLWEGRDAVELRSDLDGSRFTAIQKGKVDFQEPRVAVLSAQTCAAYREPHPEVTSEQAFQNCARRFTDDACRNCLRSR